MERAEGVEESAPVRSAVSPLAPRPGRPAGQHAAEGPGAGRAGPDRIAAGLFLTTFATLLIEILSSRLLSVLTWYHLSFFAVSLAMLGMAAGAVAVFLGGARFTGDRARTTLARAALLVAAAIPISHIATLYIPLPSIAAAGVAVAVGWLAATTLALTLPFFLSGVVVTIALTRVGGSIGRLYGWDLAGAAAGALAVVPLLDVLTLPSAFLAAGAAAAAGAGCFAAAAGRGVGLPLGVALAILCAAIVNDRGGGLLRPQHSKDRPMAPRAILAREAWNSHAFVVVQKAFEREPFYWGAGAGARHDRVRAAWMLIDGDAGTVLTEWDGRRESLEWVRHDVTAAPYYLRRGHAAIIGVGGGRDILSALWGGNRVTGIEINSLLIDTIARTHRAFAGIADRPGVALVHDEARSYLSRQTERVDVLQMSLIDTWAATGAGAFTLTENGLYTREGWRVFLEALTPTGIFSVSRWYHPEQESETNRLVSLGVAALLDRGIAEPRAHLILLARDRIATLLISPAPFSGEDRDAALRLAGEQQFDVLLSPWTPPRVERQAALAASRSHRELDAAAADPLLDYSAPTDARPFFFNQIKPRALLQDLPRESLAWGNAGATLTLAALGAVAAVLVAAIIVWPLARVGRPAMPRGAFAAALAYFALIGAGFMFIQIAFLQRFSVLLGHPTYTFSIILFSMILCTGFGSFLSDRIALEPRRRLRRLPLAIAALVVLLAVALGPATGAAAGANLAGRTLVVLAFTAPLSMLLGCCFPIGMRLVGRLSAPATAWMWGVNGACGVMASIVAVAVSMWLGIGVNLAIAAVCYLLLALPLRALART
jgi:hypothetical protein